MQMTTDIHSFLMSESCFTGLKSGCSQGCPPSGSSREHPPRLLQLLVAAGPPCRGCTARVSASACAWPSLQCVSNLLPSLLRTHDGIQALPPPLPQDNLGLSPHGKVLNCITSAKALFPYRVPLAGMRTWVCLGALAQATAPPKRRSSR